MPAILAQPRRANHNHLSAHPASMQRALWPIVTEREAGMRWTRAAMRDEHCRRGRESVWSWPPDAEAKSREMIALMMGARKPGPQGERDIRRKTIAQGRPE
jgi:hypothetical protein